MPAQKRSHPDDSSSPPSESKPDDEQLEDEQDDDNDDDEEEEAEENGDQEEEPKLSPQQQQDGDSDDDDDDDDEGGSDSDRDEFIFVKLADIRKEVQCPICLGIIRKTRTVMECLHRFCRECIDKSMRLGNNECPACRTHCASRRSLRDDPNYDALIAALYPDIDKYEAEELAFHDEEKNRNKKIQASIAETFRRQSEALGKRKPTAKATAAAFLRRSRSSHGVRGRGRTNARDALLAVSEDEEDEDSNRNDGKESSSADEPSSDRRQKRPRRWTQPRSSPTRTIANADNTGDENDEGEITRDNRGSSPLQVGNREMLVWGRGGVRSQIRHPGSNGRFVKGGRITKLVEHIRNLKKDENEFEVHLELLPMSEQSVAIQRPYICCKPTLTIRNLCQFIALQTSVNDEEVEILVRKPQYRSWELKPSNPSEELQVVGPQESLAGLCDSSTNTRGNLVLMYRLKTVN